MLFNSLEFLVFFIVITLAYFLFPPKTRAPLLLIASVYFYMEFVPVYIFILLFTIVVDYFAGIMLENSVHKRRLILLLSLVVNIGFLCLFKYYNFFADNVNGVSTLLHLKFSVPLMRILLPIGLSFHTFQAMSYTIEVYRGNQKAERNFLIYSLYVMFYPQLVAGPIERPQNLLTQFHGMSKIQFDAEKCRSGLLLMAFGLFKKVVIADRLGLYVDPIFSNPHGHTALDLIISTYFFAFQIYCDFSGYSDIAIGTALTLGIVLMKNFNMPYLADNVSEFWKRWHISLSTWFRDYVYIPLGGSRVAFPLICVNLLIVFTISGMWHGANWKYLIWGLIHGILLVIYQSLKKLKIGIKGFTFIKWLITFNLVCLAWIFFRANTVADAFYIIGKIFSGGLTYSANYVMPVKEICYCVVIILGLMAGEWYMRNASTFSNRKKILFVIGIGLGCYFLGIFTEAQFIYFQF